MSYKKFRNQKPKQLLERIIRLDKNLGQDFFGRYSRPVQRLRRVLARKGVLVGRHLSEVHLAQQSTDAKAAP